MGIRAAWTNKAYEVLSDFEWHREDEIVAAAMGLVPSEKAWRHMEAERRDNERRKARKNGGRAEPEDRPRVDDDEFILLGKQKMVKAAISSALGNGKMVLFVDELNRRWLKLGVCHTCGQPLKDVGVQEEPSNA